MGENTGKIKKVGLRCKKTDITHFLEKLEKIKNIDIYVRFCNTVQEIHNSKDFVIISSPNCPPSMHLQMTKLPGKRVSYILGIKIKIREIFKKYFEHF